MRILLIQPPFNPHLIGGGIFYMNEPLALESIGAVVPQHNVTLLDMRIEHDIEKYLSEINPDIVGITAYTTDVYVVNALLKKIKEFNKDILTVVGGHHATILPGDFINENTDVIITGEGQKPFKKLVENYENKSSFDDIPGVIHNKKGKPLLINRPEIEKNLDEYPIPDRTLTKKYRDKYFRASWRPVASIMTSRGCPHRCKFCSVWKREDGKYRARSPENVLKELFEIEEKYISISDDNFLHDVKRAESLYKLIKESGLKKTFKLIGRSDTIVKHPDIVEKWKEIGLNMMFLGLESFRDSEIKFLNKTTDVRTNEQAIDILHKNGITVAGQFIIYPDYTEDDFKALAEYVKKKNLVHPIFSVLTPLPETDLYYEKKNEILTNNYEMYDLVHCVLPTRLPREKFYKCYAELILETFYSDSGIVSKEVIEKIYNKLLNSYKLIN